MRFFLICLILAALVAISAAVFAPGTGLAEGPNPVTDKNSRQPVTALVEGQQEAIRLWHEKGYRDRTLLLVGSHLGVRAEDKAAVKSTLGLMAKGDWDAVLAKEYPTAKAYPVNVSNFIFYARKAGLIKDVYWVPPTRESVGEEPLDKFKGFLRDMGVSEPDVATLKQSGDSISGTLSGVPVRIYGLRELPDIKGEAVALIDLSFFSNLYTDEVKTPFLDLFGSFITELGGHGLKLSHVTISRSTISGLVPLNQRFAAGYLKTYFASPEKIKGGPLKAWQLRADAMYNDTFFQTEESFDAVEKAVKEDPDDPSFRYDLARAYFNLKNADRIKQEMDRAVLLDKGYYTAYIDSGGYFLSKEMYGEAEAFLLEAVKAAPGDPRPWNALYMLYVKAEKLDEAAGAMRKLIWLGFNSPGNYSELAEIYRKLGKLGKAEATLKDAAAIVPKTDTHNHIGLMLSLAKLYEESGRKKDALALYRETLDAAGDEKTKEVINARIENLEGPKPMKLIPSH